MKRLIIIIIAAITIIGQLSFLGAVLSAVLNLRNIDRLNLYTAGVFGFLITGTIIVLMVWTIQYYIDLLKKLR